MRHAVYGVLFMLAALAGACVDAPTEASTAENDSMLASSFDALSREASQQGDVERSQEFTWAALAVRKGVVPSRLTVVRSGLIEQYEAMVHAVTWVSPIAEQRAPTHRTLLAWRRVGGTLQTLMISSTADVMPVQNPLSMSAHASLAAPFAGAHVWYASRGDRLERMIGVSGTVRVSPSGAAVTCPSVSSRAPRGVTCARQKFTVAFDVDLQLAVPGTRVPDVKSPVIPLRATEQLVNGSRLLLSCAMPASDRGC
ncbi:MAG: hypothetical protein MNPFHGCM_00289 [Gemmatimonadaceae bacterium]|nr:hypothetical protein [Gemmatimonadaceae bacterium]